ncbi:hypothetical protein ACS0TY_010653 [Phlomoides rotata]
MNNGGAAPTGCFKCGRPGHWSRDCPSDPTTTTATATDHNTNPPFQTDSNSNSFSRSRPPLPTQKPKQKPPRRTRPKLTPDLLLSDAGIGRILRCFPSAFKCRGRGHEVNDLKHLLGLYAEWHSRLLPYYSFDQFVHKVEQIGSTKRVKFCLRSLQDRVAYGIDPTKLHEPQVEKNSIDEQDDAPGDVDIPTTFPENNLQNEEENNVQEDITQDMWEKATEESCEGVKVGDTSNRGESDDAAGNSNQNRMSEEERSRMEANRLRALERAAARSRAKAS